MKREVHDASAISINAVMNNEAPPAIMRMFSVYIPYKPTVSIYGFYRCATKTLELVQSIAKTPHDAPFWIHHFVTQTCCTLYPQISGGPSFGFYAICMDFHILFVAVYDQEHQHTMMTYAQPIVCHSPPHSS